jgi:hypothetical protein
LPPVLIEATSVAFSHTESISGTEHMKNSEPKSCDPYVDSLIRNADAKEARAFLKILKPLPFLIVIIAVFFFGYRFPVYYPRSRKTFLKTLLYQICSLTGMVSTSSVSHIGKTVRK